MASNVNLMQADGGGSGKKKNMFDWEAYQKQQQLENMMASQSSKNKTTTTGGGTTKGSTGSSSGSTTSSEASYGGGGYSFDLAAYLAELQRQAQERANAAYNRNMERIASAYGSAAGSLSGNYDSTVDRLNAARDKSMSDINRDAEKSLQQAYINNELTKNNLNQRLSAMGYNGGATESTMAQIANQYGNSRLGINNTRNDNLSNLNMTYSDNLAAALESYNSAKANLDLQRMQLEIQAENARQNAEAASMSGTMGIDSGYYSALQSALQSQMAYNYDPSQATNDYVAGNVTQANSASEGNNYAKWQAQQLLSGGNTVSDVKNYLASKGYTQQTIFDILKQLGAA